MKLWKKIAFVCSVILILVVTVCSGILLRQTREKILSITYEQAEDKLNNLTRSFEEMANYHYSSQDSPAVRNSLLQYCFSRFADASSVLRLGEETLYTQTDLLPEKYLPLAQYAHAERFLGEVNGRRLLIYGSAVNLLSSRERICAVYIVEDITPVYESMTRLLRQFVLIGAACIGVGLLLIVLLTRRALAPLTHLQTAAAHIAAGNYQERVTAASHDEIGSLAEDFNHMAAEVESRINTLTEKTERQQRFIGGVSHEFKTPLTALLLNIDTLQNTYMEEEERMAALAKMERQCRWLEGLVQKLLKLITLDQGLEVQPTSVPELLDQVRESTAQVLQSRGVGLDIQYSTQTLSLDGDLMRTALVNLVDNAAKASSPGQTVTLAVFGHTIEIADQGAGIPQEEIDRVTEPFYMVDKSRSKKHGGVGLGLSLVKQIVKAHGGTLAIESTLGQGTTVWICLKRSL
ncbi:MAG: sensor histidine kinase [Faecousia sp.]